MAGMQIIVSGMGLALTMLFASTGGVALASPGYDPNGDYETICRSLENAVVIEDVKNLFLIYGAQDVMDVVYAGCRTQALKVIAALEDSR